MARRCFEIRFSAALEKMSYFNCNTRIKSVFNINGKCSCSIGFEVKTKNSRTGGTAYYVPRYYVQNVRVLTLSRKVAHARVSAWYRHRI